MVIFLKLNINMFIHICHSTPAFVGLMSTLGVNDMHPNVVPESIIESSYPLDVSSNEYTDTCPPTNPMFNYGQTAPAAGGGDPCAQDLLFTFSRSSELAHALETQPQQVKRHCWYLGMFEFSDVHRPKLPIWMST